MRFPDYGSSRITGMAQISNGKREEQRKAQTSRKLIENIYVVLTRRSTGRVTLPRNRVSSSTLLSGCRLFTRTKKNSEIKGRESIKGQLDRVTQVRHNREQLRMLCLVFEFEVFQLVYGTHNVPHRFADLRLSDFVCLRQFPQSTTFKVPGGTKQTRSCRDDSVCVWD